jgi:hypothetical protein
MSNTWVNHVKKYASDHDISFKDALSLAKPSSQKEEKEDHKKPIIQGFGQIHGNQSRVHPSNQFDPLIQQQLTDEIDNAARGLSRVSQLGQLSFLNRRVIRGRATPRDLEIYQQLYQNFLRNGTEDDISIE